MLIYLCINSHVNMHVMHLHVHVCGEKETLNFKILNTIFSKSLC